MRRPKLILTVIGVGLVAALLIAARPDGQVEVVSERALVRSAEISGTLEAEESLKFGPPSIQSQWSFKISFMAPEGEDIGARQRLLAFDSSEIQIRLREALSSLETARATLDKTITSSRLALEDKQLEVAEAQAQENRARLKIESPQEIVASRDLEQARLDLVAAVKGIEHSSTSAAAQETQARNELDHLRSQVRDREAKVVQLEAEIASMTITAPSTGTVVYETNWRNEKKKIGDQVHRGQTVVSLPNLERLRATGKIDEVFAAEVKVGQRVNFTMDAFPEQTYSGRIRSINPAVQLRSRRDPRKALAVDIEVAEPDVERMRPGMSIRGDLEILRTEPVPTLPLESIAWSQGRAVVRVAGLFGSREVAPELGRRDDEWVEVRSGLDLGDRVVMPEGERP